MALKKSENLFCYSFFTCSHAFVQRKQLTQAVLGGSHAFVQSYYADASPLPGIVRRSVARRLSRRMAGGETEGWRRPEDWWRRYTGGGDNSGGSNPAKRRPALARR